MHTAWRIYRALGLFLCMGGLLSLSSCEKYLSKVPDSAMDVDINSLDGIAELLTGAYPQASYFEFMEARTDNVTKRSHGIHNSLNEAMYNWWEFDQEDLDTPLNYWIACYKGIAHANKALELLAGYPKKTERIKALYGEAFLLRAYYHFMLVNLWAETYRGELSRNDPGIPYVDKPEKNDFAHYTRGNVYEVYEKIERDLKLGITLVNDSYYAHPKFHFNKLAAYAFASRFYLFKGDWQRVVDYSTYVVESSSTELRNWVQYGKQMGLNAAGQLWKAYASAGEPANLLLTSTESRQARNLPVEQYGLTFKLQESLYKKPFVTSYIFDNCPSPLRDGKYLPKFDELLVGDAQGSRPRDLYVTNVLLSVDEAFLNRMEALALLGAYQRVREEMKFYLQRKLSKVF